MTPYRIDLEIVDSVKYTPGIKCVLGPQIAIVIASCNKIEKVYKPMPVQRPMNTYTEVEAILLGAF